MPWVAARRNIGASPYAELTRGANAALAAVLREAAATGLACNHQTGEYWLNGVRSSTFAGVSGASMTRASAGYATTLGGALVPFAANVLRHTDAGALIEASATNLFLQSDVGATQSITVTAVAHTLSFYGTGSIVLSGTGSGTLNGTGAINRVRLTFTPGAGSLTLTVTGACAFVQIETGAGATSYIATTTAAATRAADDAKILAPLALPSQWTLLAQVAYQRAPSGANQYLASAGNNAGSNWAGVADFGTSGQLLGVTPSGNTIGGGGRPAQGQTSTIGLRYNGATFSIWSAGSMQGQRTESNLATLERLALGARINGVSQMGGYSMATVFLPRAMTARELSAVAV